ncbi:Uncharacterized protein FKW44_015586 [Caligus rogercresseyi]|uniref:Reverse transcriptase domain-containing protein n=1 Tax=Caligus rogercresseyi TaxID=217165 RepID=A0A7T8H0V6_CALRO|nr:Uncharacterized protein FKW44_015586 [Caligus rogercresseyi]
MDMILEECNGAIGIADDITVYGRNTDDHDKHLMELIQAALKHSLVFNLKKCEIGVPRVKFFRNYYDKDGIHPDPEKVCALKCMPAPQNVEDLRTFLGLLTHLGEFIPLLSSNTEPLRELLKKDTKWNWTSSHQKIFRNITDRISEDCILRYFDVNKPILVQVDACLK